MRNFPVLGDGHGSPDNFEKGFRSVIPELIILRRKVLIITFTYKSDFWYLLYSIVKYSNWLQNMLRAYTLYTIQYTVLAAKIYNNVQYF